MFLLRYVAWGLLGLSLCMPCVVSAQGLLYQPGDTLAARVARQRLQQASRFFAWHAKQPGVVALESGLQYRILHRGTGAQVHMEDTVEVIYAGYFLNGHAFELRWDQARPVRLKVAHMMVGWRQALVHMREGGIWELYIPSHLAYGETGVPGLICGNEMLIYKVKLIRVVA